MTEDGGAAVPARSVVIVAGGRSRRLGRAKPLVEIGGRTVLARILDATAHITDAVLSVREVPPFERALRAEAWTSGASGSDDPPGSTVLQDGIGRRLVIVPDPIPDLGPLAGLVAGLGAAGAPLSVVLAGDLPFVTPGLVDRLSEILAEDAEADAVVPRVRGRAQPLCAAYRTSVLATAARLLASRPGPAGPSPPPAPSVMGLLDRLRVRYVGPEDIADGTDLRTATRGVDTREDLAWAADRLHGRGAVTEGGDGVVQLPVA